MDTNYRCPACFAPLVEPGSCPHCGYDGHSADQPPYLRVGAVLRARYHIGRLVRANGEGAVYLAYDAEKNCKVFVREFFPQTVCYRMNDGETTAVLTGGEEAFQNGKRSFQALAAALAHHPMDALLQIRGAFGEHNTFYTVFEHCPGATLRQLIERKGAPMSWNQAQRLFLPVIDALVELRRSGVGHYGIAPENLYIFPDGRMKLGGFCIESVRRTEQDFSPELMSGCAALEQYTAEQPLGEYTDVYALCACILYAITGVLPQEADRRKYDQRLLIAPAALEQIPPFVITALSNGLQVYADKRTPTLDALKKALIGAPQSAPAVRTDAEPNVHEAAANSADDKNAAAPHHRLRVPDFVAGLIAFVVSAAILAHVAIHYVRTDPDFPYFTFGTSSGRGSSDAESDAASGAESGADSSHADSGESQAASDASQAASDSASSSAESIPAGAVEVPNFVGQTYSAASQNGTFPLFISEKVFSDQYGENVIVEQSETGYAQPGTAIAVKISRGPSQRPLPEVRGMDISQARATLRASGFVMGQVTTERNEGMPSGTVLRFTDASLKPNESYDYGTVIDLVVSERQDEPAD